MNFPLHLFSPFKFLPLRSRFEICKMASDIKADYDKLGGGGGGGGGGPNPYPFSFRIPIVTEKD